MVITVALIYSLFQILAIHTSTLRAQQKVELLLDYMRAWHAVPSRKMGKSESKIQDKTVG